MDNKNQDFVNTEINYFDSFGKLNKTEENNNINTLFDDLREGLTQAIDYVANDGSAKITIFQDCCEPKKQ